MHDVSIGPYLGVFITIAAIIMTLGLGLGGIVSEYKQKQARSMERIALIQRGISMDEITRVFDRLDEQGKPVRDPLRALANTRRTALILLSVGVGLISFGAVLTWVLNSRILLIVPASGLLELAVGVGFLIDYRMQKRDLSRFGMELGAELANRTSIGR